ncbi:MAG TPA: LysM peptidoglycan-binding domain-containing protein [Anaerolineae bacterium]|nr:LysM peptidoglycan-binding domain-containing protein [Anaerolineae bacterium]
MMNKLMMRLLIMVGAILALAFTGSQGVAADHEETEPKGTIRGTIFHDSNGNGMHDGDEMGMPGVTVTIYSAREWSQAYYSGGDGTFAPVALRTGYYSAVLTIPEGYEATGKVRYDGLLIDDEAGTVVLGVDFGLITPAEKEALEKAAREAEAASHDGGQQGSGAHQGQGQRGQGQRYQVHAGDSLSMIAQRYGVSTKALAHANGIMNPSHIYSGQWLTIPSSGMGAAPRGHGPAGYHTVQAGETLSGIAIKYHTTIASLMATNKLPTANMIYVGQKLHIAGGGGYVSSAPAMAPAPAPVHGAAPMAMGHEGYYTVKSGDTLSEIGQWYGVSTAELMRINGIANAHHIYAGMSLKIMEMGAGMGAAPAAGPSAGIAGTAHMVQAGQTLSEIAQAYGVTTAAMMHANGIANAHHIYAGMTLMIPQGHMAAPAPAPMAAPMATRTHMVQTGQTLSGIAQAYGVTTAALMQMNGIGNAHHIYAGMTLEVPEMGGGQKVGSGGFYHTVQPGETLFMIGLKYGYTVSDLAMANQMANPHAVYAGQAVWVP